MKLLSTCAALVLFCASSSLTAQTPFNPAEVAWFDGSGANTIRGNALLRTVGGEVRTCAGLRAVLVPASAYANERYAAIFGSTSEGFLPARGGSPVAKADPEYERHTRQATCDAQGNFTFSHLPDGIYFVTALVTWGVAERYFTRTEGGSLMLRVAVHGGEVRDIVLTAS